MVHQLRPMANKLAPTLYVVGEKAMLNWNAKKDQDVQVLWSGGDGSRSLFDHFPNWPVSNSSWPLFLILIAFTKLRGLQKARFAMVIIEGTANCWPLNRPSLVPAAFRDRQLNIKRQGKINNARPANGFPLDYRTQDSDIAASAR
ncbi:uncharacterized protein DSM5745_02715 [Aspergillus mulundensis]|uniref:Uncharacterized protein n=1 Tax=Aspergillus mulundensis TaxID=1810919 RepID=A0A3D8SIF2_9EURO|nr:hypothetical protein DSM5745_02715 [Aspergillus mulundensis]RDW86073.1 hypothetical protein DSM5745_02715 [Aspergillus mulundensis]